MPVARVSRPMAAATSDISSVFQVEPRPMACGKTVAPSNMLPWSDSPIMIRGMPCRVSSTRKRWMRLKASGSKYPVQ